MGTNYEWVPDDACPTCGRGSSSRHIGKSSSGWAFTLHVYPDEGINDLHDWFRIMRDNRGWILDEYGRVVSLDALMEIITLRPANVWRAEVDGKFCIGHGEGTYDYIVGEFS